MPLQLRKQHKPSQVQNDQLKAHKRLGILVLQMESYFGLFSEAYLEGINVAPGKAFSTTFLERDLSRRQNVHLSLKTRIFTCEEGI